MNRMNKMEEWLRRKNEVSALGDGYLNRQFILFILEILSQLIPGVICICTITAKTSR